jgi:hypothetical protein
MHCWPPSEVSVKSEGMEEPMKKFIYVTVALTLALILIGCVAPMTPEQRKELYESREINNLTEGVGNKPFVGSPNNLDARGQLSILTW